MMLPAPDDRGIVVFRLWPSLAYPTRMVAAFALIAVGLVLQAATAALLPGLVVLAAGNLLLLVRGYDNRVDFGRYQPDASWERVEPEKLAALERLDRQIKRWDLSALDVTNVLGATVFALVAGLLALAAWSLEDAPRILAADGLVLLVPHWLTGVRRILTRPRLMIKVKLIRRLLDGARAELRDHRVDLLVLLTGGRDVKLPSDVKFKVDIHGHHPDFLGLYGQVVLNEVQGRSYPYFYVVLVARRGFGLGPARDRFTPPPGVTTELEHEGEVEVLVIRRRTTRTSGYHTRPGAAGGILREGLALAEQVAASRGA